MTDILAKEAQRLLDDATLKLACEKVRHDALEALARADVGQPIQIMRLQQKVAVIDEIRLLLRSAAAELMNKANSAGTFA